MPGGRLSTLFWEIENLRDHHLPAMLSRYRTDLEVSFRNRSYHACETIESRFMQHFFHNLCKRERISSAIWLHDGMWIAQEVSDDAIRLAEVESLRHVFPGVEEQEPIFTIVSLTTHFTRLVEQLSSRETGPPLWPELPRRFRHCITPQHAPPCFQQKTADPRAEEKQDHYIERVHKRPRL